MKVAEDGELITCESAAAGPAKYFLGSMHNEDDTAKRTRPITDRYEFQAIVSKKRFGLSLHRFDLLNQGTHLAWWGLSYFKRTQCGSNSG